MNAAWLNLREMEEAVASATYTDVTGQPVRVEAHMAKQIARVIADASKAKATQQEQH